MRTPILASAIALCTGTFAPEHSNAQGDCTLDNNYCVPFVGCLTARSEFFVGRSLGRREGPVGAITTGQIRCQGSWKRTVFGLGVARFQCEDGRSGRVTYSYLDRRTGTAVGKGRTNNGQTVEFWAGHRLIDYLADDPRMAGDVFECGARALRLR